MLSHVPPLHLKLAPKDAYLLLLPRSLPHHVLCEWKVHDHTTPQLYQSPMPAEKTRSCYKYFIHIIDTKQSQRNQTIINNSDFTTFEGSTNLQVSFSNVVTCFTNSRIHVSKHCLLHPKGTMIRVQCSTLLSK